MSSGMSGFGGEHTLSIKSGGRTPLRSLDNEKQHLSTSSFKLKALLNPDASEMTVDAVRLCDPEPVIPPLSGKAIPTSPPSVDTAGTRLACELGNVTFKSFICTGGEVEIPCSLLCAEERILLPKFQAENNNTPEDTVMSQSLIEQSYCDHIEHPYHMPRVNEPFSGDINAAAHSEIPNNTLTSIFQAAQDSRAFQNDDGGEQTVTLPPFVCDGGEVEISDNTRPEDDMINLPCMELEEALQGNGINSSIYPDESSQLCQDEPIDHPYCSSVISPSSETGNCFENPTSGLSDITVKTLDCSGCEIEISEDTKPADETVPLPSNHSFTSTNSRNNGMDSTFCDGDDDFQNDEHHEHAYSHFQNCLSLSHGSLSTTEEQVYTAEIQQVNMPSGNSQVDKQEQAMTNSLFQADEEADVSDKVQQSGDVSYLLKDEMVIPQPPEDKGGLTCLTQHHTEDHCEQPRTVMGNEGSVHADSAVIELMVHEAVIDGVLPAKCEFSVAHAFLKASNNDTVNCQEEEMTLKETALPSPVLTAEVSDCLYSKCLSGSPTPLGKEQHLERVFQEHVTKVLPEFSDLKDSALGLSGNEPFGRNHTEKASEENMSGVLKVLSECPSVASALQMAVLSPAMRRVSQMNARGDHAQGQLLAEELDVERTIFFSLANRDPSALWAEQLESPMPHPMFNSTTINRKPQLELVKEPAENFGEKHWAEPQLKGEKPVLNMPLIPEGPLQLQLQQMAEFLMMASGKMGPAVAPAAAPLPAPSIVSPVESHTVYVGRTPVKLVDHSLNTSGLYERKREFSVADSCTMTDPLIWNLPPGSLEGLPRQELEQRLSLSMIMVEALVQQLAAARLQGRPSQGAAPSDLRDRLVQTDHTELNQTTIHRALYMEALSRIGELELDVNSLHNLLQHMQDTRIIMTSLSSETNAALSNMKEIGDIVRKDHQSLVSHYGHMKSLYEKSREMQTRMMQKVKEAFHRRNDMRSQMEEALAAKEAALSTMTQLRMHCATEISALERSVGSRQELMSALNQTFPELVALNKAYTETSDSASRLLTQTKDEQSCLIKELNGARSLLQKAAPILLQLNEKTANALRERDEHISARDQAICEREQIEEELSETHLKLKSAKEQISDLNLQVTILTSEMNVLRQKLTEKEGERGHLEMKVTELSATVSSTLASYTFLEQALAAESTKLQQSWQDVHEAKERTDELETSLAQSKQCVCDLTQALAQSEEQLCQLRTLSHSQTLQIQQLQDVCTQLSSMQEMNEFLQMENELAREQVAESEKMLRENLKGLRERNIQCEDLKGELCQLQTENRNLQEELETTKSKANATQLQLKEKLAQAITDITLLHHTLRGLANELHAAITEQKPEPKEVKGSEQTRMDRNHCSGSADSVLEDSPPGSDVPRPYCDSLFSETSAFNQNHSCHL
ncbi:sperm-associated antigen 5 [Pholidichthys leucotaenia]